MTDDPQDETLEIGGLAPGSDPSDRPTVPLAGRSQTFPGGFVRRPRLAEGQLFGHYRVLRELGRGGMGEVYEAEDTESGRLVALKLLPMIGVESLRKRVVREGRLAAQVSHPNSVYVFEADEIEGVPVIAMEIIRGGTLSEKVARDRALPVNQAVDSMLQVIAGLHEAEGNGILHRDVKPSNCFIEPDGNVKVGDYGLSMSTSIGAEATRLTTDGSQLGTPAFASPEQMRGRETDVRSDIYSVGATLYYLLTGRAPFEAENAVELIAKVLGDPVTPPAQLRPEIPKGLERAVLRCLAREPDRRFADYDQLAKALEPFRARQESPAGLGIRFSAGFVDHFVLTITGMFYGAAHALMGQAFKWSTDPRGEMLFALAINLLYFGLLEGLWGASLGKRLFGLRVTRVDGKPPGLLRAFARVLLYSFASFFVLLTSSRMLAFAIGWFFLLLWVTARKRNGFAAIHDLLTDTRVVQRRDTASRVRLEQMADFAGSNSPEPVEPAVVGPFDVVGELPVAGTGRLLLGHDSRLRRDVWLHLPPGETAGVDEKRRNLARAGRLRWIGGRRERDQVWNAYEAPNGAPFSGAVTEPQRWPTLRDWLFDVAQEIVHAADDGTSIERLTPSHVWIGADGRARLLDWALEPEATPATDESYAIAEPERQRQFLLRIVHEALTGGSPEPGDLSARPVAAPLPLHARKIIEDLGSGEIVDAAELVARLDETAALPRRVERRRRMIQLGIQAALPGFVALTFGIGALFALVADDDLKMNMLPGIAAILANFWVVAILPLALLAVVTAFAFRGGATLRLLQFAVVDRNGREIGRAWSAARGLAVWGVLILVACFWIATIAPAAIAAASEVGPFTGDAEAAAEWGGQLAEKAAENLKGRIGRFRGASLIGSGPLALLLFLGGLAYVVRNPARGIQDRLVGTELVPR